jgi:hypothetical protein
MMAACSKSYTWPAVVSFYSSIMNDRGFQSCPPVLVVIGLMGSPMHFHSVLRYGVFQIAGRSVREHHWQLQGVRDPSEGSQGRESRDIIDSWRPNHQLIRWVLGLMWPGSRIQQLIASNFPGETLVGGCLALLVPATHLLARPEMQKSAVTIGPFLRSSERTGV